MQLHCSTYVQWIIKMDLLTKFVQQNIGVRKIYQHMQKYGKDPNEN